MAKVKSHRGLKDLVKKGIPLHFCLLPFAFCLLTFSLASCKWKHGPTYPSATIASDLKKMLAKDYSLNVETRKAGGTLQTSFWRVGLLKPGQLEMQPEAAEALERVLLCATRVSLSTDAQLQFLQVKMADALTGATVTLWRFVPDIKDSMYTRLPEDEYINRLVIEFDPDRDPKREWKENNWDKPITMAEFLAKQVVLRIKRQSGVGLQAHEDLSKPATLTVVVDNWDSLETQGGQPKKVQELVEKTARKVMKGYRYTGFHEFVLKNQQGLALKSWTL
jgi:hypothetical protein